MHQRKKETRHVGPNHVFGLNSGNDPFGAADIVRSRSYDRALRGKDKERAYVSALRAYLARYNYTMFKTLVAAFKFYDQVKVECNHTQRVFIFAYFDFYVYQKQDKDGFVSKDELRTACFQSGFPVADDLLDLLLADCDFDCDGRLNFLEFANFLCFKNSMKTGIDFDPSKKFDKKRKDFTTYLILVFVFVY